MPRIPAICINPDCGFVFPSSIEIENSTNIVFQDVSSGPCPKCGSNGKIPNGKYDIFNNSIFAMLYNVGDATIISKSIALFRSQISTNKAPEEMIEKAKAEVPELQSLWDLIPNTRTEAYAFITMLILFLKIFLEHNPSAKQPSSNTVNIQQQIINQSFQQFYSSSAPATASTQPKNRSKTNKKQSQKSKKYERNKHKRR